MLRRLSFCLLLLGLATLLQAQNLTETHISSDNIFQFDYPSGWEVSGEGLFVFAEGNTSRGVQMTLAVFNPTIIALLTSSETDPVAALDSLQTTFDFINTDAKPVTINGRDGAIATTSPESATQAGYAVIVPLSDGSFGLITAVARKADVARIEDLLLDIAATYDLIGGTGDGSSTLPVPTPLAPDTITLHRYSGNYENALDELRDLGLIGEGGSLVFEEDYAFFNGVGSWFTSLGGGQSFSDVVVAGELTYTPGSDSEYESCALMARVHTSRSGATVFLEFGMDNSGVAYYYDSPTTGEYVGYNLLTDIDYSQPHHFLAIVVQDRITVFFDGEMIGEELPVEDRSGTYGVSLVGRGSRSKCEARNLWAYQFPYFEAGTCEIVATANVNKRTGPGTGFSQSGQMRRGTSLRAVAATTDNAGYVWFQLEDETWVRSDIVDFFGDCANLPSNANTQGA